MPDVRDGIPLPVPSAVRRVRSLQLQAAAGYQPVTDEGWDGELCGCQRLRPVAGSTVCVRCLAEAGEGTL